MSAARRPLTPAEVLAIRAKWDSGRFTARGIASLYGCAAETVARIGRRETWAWLSEAGPASPPADRLGTTHGEQGKDAQGTPAQDDAQASLERLLEELKEIGKGDRHGKP